MKAYHGQQAIKDFYLARVRQHRELGQLRQGCTWNEIAQCGCAVGCTIHAYNHQIYEEQIGIPREVAQLKDGIFEGLFYGAQEWPERFLEAIKPGADLTRVWPTFARWMLLDPDYGVISGVEDSDVRSYLEGCAAAFSYLDGCGDAFTSHPDHIGAVTAGRYVLEDDAAGAVRMFAELYPEGRLAGFGRASLKLLLLLMEASV